MRRSPLGRPSSVLALSLALSAGLLTACSAPSASQADATTDRWGRKTPVANPAPSEVGLENLANQSGRVSPPDLQRMLDEQVKITEQYRAELAAKNAKPSPTPNPNNPNLAAPPPASTSASAPQQVAQTPQAAPAPNIPTSGSAGLTSLTGATSGETAAPSPETPNLAPINAPLSVRLNTAADELAKALRERAAASSAPAGDYAALAWLDTIRPGVLAPLDTGPSSRVLDPRQIKSINVMRDIASRISNEPKLLNDPDQLWRSMTDAAAPITQTRDVRIATSELCSRVDGFGQYTPLLSRALLAGAPHTIIVYAEVESFGYRKAIESSGERYTVELGQAVEIWQDADRPTLQRRWGETTINDQSRRQRRDFYLTSVIELPSNLSVGAYNLKIIVKDHLRGGQAERSVAFTIVADPSVSIAGQ